MRLDKFLSETGNGTRTEVKNLIRKGNVTINGIIVKKPELKIDENSDSVFVAGKKIEYSKYEYYMLNKPAGYVSATQDKKEHTVLELITCSNRDDLFPVGRLDKDTEGLLIISNDGEMAHRILSPRHHVSKTYFAKVQGTVTDENVLMVQNGLDIGEGIKTRPGELEIIISDEISEIMLTIYEGKFHQVKRMFESMGMKVVYLKRISMGAVCLDETLRKGESRKLTDNEISELRKELD